MSNRTLLELNHDYADKIRRDPEGFVGAVLELARAGATPQAVVALRDFGVTTVLTRHHSEQAHIRCGKVRVST